MSPGVWSFEGERAQVWPGSTHPLGATWSAEATNFAVHAPEASGVWVCLFDEEGAETRYPLTEHSLGIWHGAVPGVPLGARYGYRADGPWDPARGFRFNIRKLLLDPCAKAISGDAVHGDALLGYDPQNPDLPSRIDSAPAMPRSVVIEDHFDWGEDRPLQRRWRDTVIYEMHVRGFTRLHPELPEGVRGTYAGLGHPAVTDYLTGLGVTAIELLPIHQFVTEPAVAARGMRNYWGYNSIGFFAPHGAYSSSGDRGQQVVEFKQMVKALHAAGIEVILDVVYNHTAEGRGTGPTLSFRGLDDRGYYHRVGATDHQDGLPAPYVDEYWDVTGCGNTVAAAHPPVLRMILDSLRYWVTEMHVDGFRFDLASALTRSGYEVDMHSHLLTTIGQDPILRHVKLIAEPWDASPSGYRVGAFPPPWVEWNDRYRDTLRDFWRGRGQGTRDLATRLAGSSDLYADDGRSPYASVNFVTAHDGFTLRDLVSYDHKHNQANGEGDRDGTDDNRSWNHGVEGETDDPAVVALRQRQAANLAISLCLSAGVPMLVAGDERGRTQRGNNNPYVQDNEISWLDWTDDSWAWVRDLVRAALRLRREHPALRQRHWFEGRPAIAGGPKDLAWIHPEGREMTGDDWADDGLRVIGMFVSGSPLRSPGSRGEQQWDASFLVWLHAGGWPVEVRLPENAWVQRGEVVVSTDEQHPVGGSVQAGQSLALAARSLLVLREAGDVARPR